MFQGVDSNTVSRFYRSITEAYEKTKQRWYKAPEGSYYKDSQGFGRVWGLTLGSMTDRGRELVFLQERYLDITGTPITLIDDSTCREVSIDFAGGGTTPTVTFVVRDEWAPDSSSWLVRYIKDERAKVFSLSEEFFEAKSVKDQWPYPVDCTVEIDSEFIKKGLRRTKRKAVYHTAKKTFRPLGSS